MRLFKKSKKAVGRKAALGPRDVEDAWIRQIVREEVQRELHRIQEHRSFRDEIINKGLSNNGCNN